MTSFATLLMGVSMRDIDDLLIDLREKSIDHLGFDLTECEQGSEEWHTARLGVITASRAEDIYKKLKNGKYEVHTKGGTKASGIDPVDFAIQMEAMGAGEILINSIDRDGTRKGYDIDLIKAVTNSLTIPVIACGGAGKIEDCIEAIHIGNASAVSAGSLFVFHGKRQAVLINFPAKDEIERLFSRID